MNNVAPIAGAIMAALSLHAIAVEGDDWVETCTQQPVSINYYQGTAYCTASSNGQNYPLSYYVNKTTESSVVLSGGGGLSCRAQVPFLTTETSYRTVCTKAPREPYPIEIQHTSFGCISQRAVGEVSWRKYDVVTEVEKSFGGGTFSPVGTFVLSTPFPQYSYAPPGGTVTYRLRSRLHNSSQFGSFRYITFSVPNCQGRLDN